MNESQARDGNPSGRNMSGGNVDGGNVGSGGVKSGQFQAQYSEEKRIEVLAALEKNRGNVAKTAREAGVSEDTVRRWRGKPRSDAAAPDLKRSSDAAAPDLKRFSKDSWEIIHRANEVVREKVDELGAKDAASIAAGYFDRQAKAEEQMNSSGDEGQEYVAQWGEGKERP